MMVLDSISAERGGQTVVKGLSARLEAGHIHAVIGPNGTGKTTLLRAIFGDLPLAAGSISLGDRRLRAGERAGRYIRQWRDGFAYMPQDTTSDIALSVLEVVALGRFGRLSLHIDDETLDLAMTRLHQAGIAHLAGREIASLSGGQRQMALFAQVLMREPQAMLLDEPVSALDLKHQVALLDLVQQETRANGWVTLVVLHDLNLACQYADNLLVISGGALKATGAPGDIVTPKLISETYGVTVEVLRDRRGNPVIQPAGDPLPEHFKTLEGIIA
ncbi:ABC transporter ATP-binding protein [Agrobacterium tumefaciens]|uniref:ABC transporter ATP-binding protein n=1 Tax=Agrobacterium tumefaciens TaxID=358 RepID=UPI0009BB50C1|nr:ABC transporter ATP-binding protein [Agrobacterium tumefaciens]NTC85087.1 ABC transporter ATP-binding protein [Agrobacterium tumefaciens]NTD12327.1 ABC transporter ATP-binding protein [Agrobacterium tumefaciens]QTQ83348.1 ABC transporter ATP-binding protein [Agrobacterium tumefaciens]CUW96959.1 Fe III dicitrate ABC transporter, ATP-binding protein [Agrobacterium fabacearum S56]